MEETSIDRTKIFFILGVSLLRYSRTKKTEGQRLVKQNLTPEGNPVSSGVAF